MPQGSSSVLACGVPRAGSPGSARPCEGCPASSMGPPVPSSFTAIFQNQSLEVKKQNTSLLVLQRPEEHQVTRMCTFHTSVTPHQAESLGAGWESSHSPWHCSSVQAWCPAAALQGALPAGSAPALPWVPALALGALSAAALTSAAAWSEAAIQSILHRNSALITTQNMFYGGC